MRVTARVAALAAAVVALVAVPVAVRERPAAADAAAEVIVWTPHHEQIRAEFGEGFARWHERRFGTPAVVTWNAPGGIGDIRRMLEDAALAALRSGDPVGGNADVLFGGGAHEFSRLARPLEVRVGGALRRASVLEPVELDPAFLAEVYGDGTIAGRALRDPGGHWFGAALAAFGLVWNNDALARLGVPAPAGWEALADPRLRGEVAMVNPAQSGSAASAIEAILLREGWDRGWAILRRAAANARSVSASGTRAPSDVSQGEAAIAPCIDFYGRFEQQAVADGGSPGRIGYAEPAGETAVDPDPVAVLRGAPHPELARRFVEFVLSEDGQRLWQLPPGAPGGPRRFALRRLPVHRGLHAAGRQGFVDPVDPWAIAGAAPPALPGVRPLVAPVFASMAIDNRRALREAWARIVTHPAYPPGAGVVRAGDVSDGSLRAMLEEFDRMPEVPAPGGGRLDLADESARCAVRDGWLAGRWKGEGLWPAGEPGPDALRRLLAAGTARSLAAVHGAAIGGPR